MARLSLCIEPILKEYSLPDRIRIAAEAGYRTVEFWEPAGRDLAGMGAAASSCGVGIAACLIHESPAHPLCRPGPEALDNLRRSIGMAGEIGCRTLIGLAGDAGGPLEAQRAAIVEILRSMTDTLVRADVTLVLEPLNTRIDHPGYFLDSSAAGFGIVREVGCPNIRLLFDVYHMQIMEGSLTASITDNIENIGHFHLAGVPGRHEPTEGEVDYRYLLGRIDALGYDRYAGLEYWPSHDHRESIARCRAYLASAPLPPSARTVPSGADSVRK